jgi:3-mercaptopyruvate sulfurtransferase SseA
LLLAAGRGDVAALRGGLDAWEAKGYPMETATG